MECRDDMRKTCNGLTIYEKVTEGPVQTRNGKYKKHKQWRRNRRRRYKRTTKKKRKKGKNRKEEEKNCNEGYGLKA